MWLLFSIALAFAFCSLVLHLLLLAAPCCEDFADSKWDRLRANLVSGSDPFACRRPARAVAAGFAVSPKAWT